MKDKHSSLIIDQGRNKAMGKSNKESSLALRLALHKLQLFGLKKLLNKILLEK